MDTDRQTGLMVRIEVQGTVDERWTDWFGAMEIVPADVGGNALVTTLVGVVADQAALRGILTKLWDLNLSLVSVSQVDRGLEGGRSSGTEDATGWRTD